MAIVPIDIDDNGGSGGTSATNAYKTGFNIGGVTPTAVMFDYASCNLIKVGDIGVWNAYPMNSTGATTTTISGDDVEGSRSGCSYIEAITTMSAAAPNNAHCTLYARIGITSSKLITIALNHRHVFSGSGGQRNYAELTVDGEIVTTSPIRIPSGDSFLSNDSSFFARIYICNSTTNIPGTSSPDPFILYVDYGYRTSSGTETVVGTAKSNIHYNGTTTSGPLCENPYAYWRRINQSGAASNISCTIKTVKVRN